jgi:hypothetical protein
MQKINLTVIVLLVFFVYCNAPVKRQENTNSNIVSKDTITDTDTDTDTLRPNIQRINLEIEENSICFDTLKIVSGNCKLLYYPVGTHRNIEFFLSSLQKEVFIEKQIKANGTETYHIQIKNNSIEVLVGDNYCGNNNSAVNIVSAEIKDNAIEIVNCIKTGTTKQSFIEMLNLEHISNLNEIKVVEISSILAGIWQYYTFDKSSILNKIEIKSDYVFE